MHLGSNAYVFWKRAVEQQKLMNSSKTTSGTPFDEAGKRQT